MKIFYKISIIIIIYGLLSIPDNSSSIHISTINEANASAKWWGTFAQNLVKYRITNKQNQQYQYNKHRFLLKKHLDELLLELAEPDNDKLDSINLHINKLSTLASLLPSTINEFEDDVMAWRKLLKYQSRYWDSNSEFANKRLSKFVIESELALESAIIQSNTKTTFYNSSNKTKNADSRSINKIHFVSGDVITFNLKIDEYANVYYQKELPNGHKHIGTIYIEDSVASVIYMDPELGLIAKPINEFINLAPNAVILRLRKDLPNLLRNPNLPELAALNTNDKILNGNYKFDFKYDLETHDYLFDWEVIEKALKSQGLSINIKNRGPNLSSIYFGKRSSNVTSIEVLLDQRFILVGQWSDSENLQNQRLLTAATTALVENQSSKQFLNLLLLPGYRLLKAYSMIVDNLGLTPPIAKGVAAQTQLMFNTLRAKQTSIVKNLKKEIRTYELAHNHKATYLKIIQKANEIVIEQKGD